MGGDPTVIAATSGLPNPSARETSGHIRSVFTFLVLFYLLTVPRRT